MRIPFYTAWKERREAEIKRREAKKQWLWDWDTAYGCWLKAINELCEANKAKQDTAEIKKRIQRHADKLKALLNRSTHETC